MSLEPRSLICANIDMAKGHVHVLDWDMEGS